MTKTHTDLLILLSARMKKFFRIINSQLCCIAAVILLFSTTSIYPQDLTNNLSKNNLFYAPSLNLIRINEMSGLLLVNETGLNISKTLSVGVAFNYLLTPIETNLIKTQDSDLVRRKFHLISSGIRAGYKFYKTGNISISSSFFMGPALIFFNDDGYKWKENLETLLILNPQFSAAFKIGEMISINTTLGYMINIKSNLRFIDQSDLNTISIGFGLIIGD